MTLLAAILIAAPIVIFVYAYAVYPLVLRLAAGARPQVAAPEDPAEWPSITVVIAAYNAEPTIGRTLEHLLAADYPSDRRQIIVASDGCTDDTAGVVAGFALRGVELRRLEPRGGKTTAENRVADDIRGEIVVSTDASVVVPEPSIKRLVRHFRDPSLGVASGWAVAPPRTTGVASGGDGDAGYFRYEMRVREMEARFGAIIGAMGGLYAIRRDLFRVPLPPYIARDFASTLVAWERGYRSLIDPAATCLVGRGVGLRAEYERKARTMLNGLDTLHHFSHLLDPMRHGWFAFMLLSHKLCRWLVYLFAPAAIVGLALLARDWWPARAVLAIGIGLAVVAPLALRRRPAHRRLAGLIAACSYALVSVAAAVVGWARYFMGRHATTWAPTRREL